MLFWDKYVFLEVIVKLIELHEVVKNYTNAQLINKSIKTCVNDPACKVESAVWLVNKCYRENNTPIPKDLNDEAYSTYVDTIIDTVKQLHKSTTKGIRDDSWKITADDSPFR
jgi:hypothetical protein